MQFTDNAGPDPSACTFQQADQGLCCPHTIHIVVFQETENVQIRAQLFKTNGVVS